MLDTLDPPTAHTGHAAHLRTDLTPLEAIELSLTTDDTKRCEWDYPSPCPEAAVWFAAMVCDIGHGTASCAEHRASLDDLITRGAVISCKVCGRGPFDAIIWRAL